MSASLRPALVATGTVLAAAVVRLALSPLLGWEAPLLIFALPVFASAVYGGPRAGVMATLLGAALGTLLFIPPVGSLVVWTTVDVVRISIFVSEGLVVAWLISRVEWSRREVVTAKTRAEEANRAKDQFLAVLSHELRTPLNVMLCYARMMRMKHATLDRMTAFAEIIERNGVLLTRLVEDLLDVQRIARGQLALESRTFDLAPLVDSVMNSLQPSAVGKRLRVEASVPSIQMEGDPARLQQVLWNLLSNAVKFTPEQGRIRIAAATQDATVHIRVENSDAPIPTAFLPRVFEPFQQADMTTTRRHSGVGLGLWVVKNIVDLHHGTVQVHSDAERTVFTLNLPKAQPQTVPDAGRVTDHARLRVPAALN